jgi:hypothetical protein
VERNGREAGKERRKRREVGKEFKERYLSEGRDVGKDGREERKGKEGREVGKEGRKVGQEERGERNGAGKNGRWERREVVEEGRK